MRTHLILFITAILAVSCATMKDNTKQALDSWIGHDKHELITTWGPPYSTTSDGADGEVLVYYTQSYNYYYGITNYYYRYMYVNGSGKIYGWKTDSGRVPPTQIVLPRY